MLQSNSLFFRFRNRNGKRQAILTYVEACGDCRFERRSPPSFFLTVTVAAPKTEFRLVCERSFLSITVHSVNSAQLSSQPKPS